MRSTNLIRRIERLEARANPPSSMMERYLTAHKQAVLRLKRKGIRLKPDDPASDKLIEAEVQESFFARLTESETIAGLEELEPEAFHGDLAAKEAAEREALAEFEAELQSGKV
jgi:hypothetical protein